jgi:hypothetical protein
MDEWRSAALQIALDLANRPVAERQQLVQALQQAINQSDANRVFSAAEVINLSKLIFALNGEVVRPAAVVNIIADLRLSAIKARAGVAVVLNKRRSLSEDEANTLAEIVELLDEDDFLQIEGNHIAGVVGLYGMPGSVEMIAQSAARLQQLKPQPNEPGSRVTVASAFMGTVQLRGNQLVRLAIGQMLLEELERMVDNDGSSVLRSDVFARILLDGNVLEGTLNLAVARHLNLQANEFSQTAAPRQRSSFAGAPTLVNVVAWAVADSAIYIGNQAVSENSRLFDIARISQRVGNIQLTII